MWPSDIALQWGLSTFCIDIPDTNIYICINVCIDVRGQKRTFVRFEIQAVALHHAMISEVGCNNLIGQQNIAVCSQAPSPTAYALDYIV